MAASPQARVERTRVGALPQEGEALGAAAWVAGPSGLRSRCGKAGGTVGTLSSSGGGRVWGGRKERTALPCRVRRPCCHSGPGPVLRLACGGGAVREAASDPGFRGVGCALGNSGCPTAPVGEEGAPRSAGWGPAGCPPAPACMKRCVFPVACGDVAAGPSWVKSSL